MHHSANDHRHPRCPRSWTNVGLSGLRADETGKRKNALVGSASCCGMTRPERRLKKGLSREWREGQGDSGWFLASHYEAKRDASLTTAFATLQATTPPIRFADPPTRRSADPFLPPADTPIRRPVSPARRPVSPAPATSSGNLTFLWQIFWKQGVAHPIHRFNDLEAPFPTAIP